MIEYWITHHEYEKPEKGMQNSTNIEYNRIFWLNFSGHWVQGMWENVFDLFLRVGSFPTKSSFVILHFVLDPEFPPTVQFLSEKRAEELEKDVRRSCDVSQLFVE